MDPPPALVFEPGLTEADVDFLVDDEMVVGGAGIGRCVWQTTAAEVEDVEGVRDGSVVVRCCHTRSRAQVRILGRLMVLFIPDSHL